MIRLYFTAIKYHHKVLSFKIPKLQIFQNSNVSKLQISHFQIFPKSRSSSCNFLKSAGHIIAKQLKCRDSHMSNNNILKMIWYFLVRVEILLHKVRESKSAICTKPSFPNKTINWQKRIFITISEY